MSPAQEGYFAEGAGGAIDVGTLLFLFQALGGISAFLYVAWIFVTSYRDFGVGDISGTQMLYLWVRSIVILMVFLYLLFN